MTELQQLRQVMLTQNNLKKYLYYDPETGLFYSRKSMKTLGGKHNGGYITIVINKKAYLSHRLAFLYMEGYFPENDIDHIDRNKQDNRWKNLREVSRSCNMRNAKQYKTNSSGIKGVSVDRYTGKWLVTIWNKSKRFNLGRYDCLVEASCARLAAEQALGWPGCESDSPAYKFVRHYLGEF